MAELRFNLTLPRAGVTWEMEGAVPLQGVTAVMGPSGSGKTTLLRMLAGLEPGARGAVRCGDAVWADGRRSLRPEARRIGMVFQDGRLFDHLSVAENLAYGARRRGVAPAAMHGIAAALGLGPLMHRAPPTLSGGEGRRVAVARALAAGPDILLMDEPLSGLDDDAKAQVLPYLARALAETGVPAVYVTHARTEVDHLADRVLLIRDGRVEGWGRPPAQLSVSVVKDLGDHVKLSLGGAEFVLPGHARAGDARRIALPEDGVLVSLGATGPSGALAVLSARVVSVAPRPGGMMLGLEVGGERIAWRAAGVSAIAERPPSPGDTVSLSVLQAYLR